MFLLCVIVYFCLIGQRQCSQLDKNFNELRLAEWQCDSVCVGSGGRAAFDLKNKICKCALDENTDDIEGQLILKDANFLGTPFVITRDIVKRQANSDSTLGQRAPHRITGPRTILRTTTRRPFQFASNRAFATTPRTNTDIQQRLRQIQKRINDRRTSRTGGLTGPRLQQRLSFSGDDSPPNLMERLRLVQKQVQEKLASRRTASPHVAAPAPKINADNSHQAPTIGASRNTTTFTNDKATDMELTRNGKKSNFEVIIQDPSLYDKDD